MLIKFHDLLSLQGPDVPCKRGNPALRHSALEAEAGHFPLKVFRARQIARDRTRYESEREGSVIAQSEGGQVRRRYLEGHGGLAAAPAIQSVATGAPGRKQLAAGTGAALR